MSWETAIAFLLPLREKVARAAGRMRGRSSSPVRALTPLGYRRCDPSSVGSADTFSRKGRRTPWAGFLAAGFLALTAPALADVVSPHPDAVAVPVYRDGDGSTTDLMDLDSGDDPGLAMITETPAGDRP